MTKSTVAISGRYIYIYCTYTIYMLFKQMLHMV